ncbi:hypothetical protein BD413DRAFT_463173 [Trametes elegans]|nr:hypothetical protein BD413DRAFT_463173 [Trametes elegans]
MPPIPPLANSTLSLDVSSLAGFLGADAALSAMMLPHLHAERKWWGWYNCPGSYYLAKRYWQLARLRAWSPLHKPSSIPHDLAIELGGDVVGPRYTAAHSGATLARTSPLATMLVEACSAGDAIEAGGRYADRMDVAIIPLQREPAETVRLRVPRPLRRWLALLPIGATLSTGIACAYYRDRFVAAVIFLSAFCHGLACVVMGGAQFTYEHRIPLESPRLASGWLDAGKTFVVLYGSEAAVAPVTRGRFTLKFEHERARCALALCAILLGLQFLLQLLLVPQGVLFGQILFIASIVVSWAYHRLILAEGEEAVQRSILMGDILGGPAPRRYRFGTRTTAAVFAVLALREAIGGDIEARLRALLPTGTTVWDVWHATVGQKIKARQPLRFGECDEEWQGKRGLVDNDERDLFETLLRDAETAYVVYEEHRPCPAP